MPLKVGIYSSHYPGINGAGGIATYTCSLATGLVQLGHQVHVLTIGDSRQSQSIDGVNIHFVEKRHFRGIERLIPGAREAWTISGRAYSLTQTHGLDIFEFPNWEGRGAFFRFGMFPPPMVVRLHTSMQETLAIDGKAPTFAQRFECRLERTACMLADSLYVSTKAHQRHMAKELRIPESRMSVVPLGIPDVDRREAREPRPRGATPTILYLGRLERRKGTTVLLEALPTIVEAFPNARIIFAGKDRPQAPGDVTHEEYFNANFPESLRRNVEFRGFTSESELQELFLRADVFVAPSIYESFGLIFVEAMRWSVPVIGTHAGGIPEVVTDGINGQLVPAGSTATLARAIIRVLSDEALRLKLAYGARKTYEEKFTHLVMAARTAEHYQTVVRARKPASQEKQVPAQILPREGALKS